MTRGVVGTGEHLYQTIHPFGELPVGMTFGNASHVATDSSNRVYVFRRQDPPVLVFDRDGHFLTSWGAGMFLDAHGIFMTSDDEIYLVDRDAHEVLKCGTDGRVLLRIGTRERPSLNGPFNHPADIAVAGNGDLFNANGYGNSRVHRFTAEGKLLFSWGTPGNGPGEFTTPHGIWVDQADRVYVCNRDNNRVQIFNTDGEYLAEWPDFYHSMDIYVDRRGEFYVMDQIPRITVLDAAGKLLARGRTPFNDHGMWINSLGDIYLANNAEGVTKLVKTVDGVDR